MNLNYSQINSAFPKIANLNFKIKYLLIFLIIFLISIKSQAQFTAGNLVVIGQGDSTTTLANSATAVNVIELTKSGTVVSQTRLRTTTSGTQRRITQSGTATSEGAINLSTNRRFLTVVGYDAALGTASIVGTASSSTPRVIGLIDSNRNLNSQTYTNVSYTANNIRSAATTDGTGFWISGAATGLGYLPFFGGSTTVTALNGLNTRVVSIFNGQLYATSASGTNIGTNTVGSGLPSTTGQTVTLLSGATGAGNAYAFLLLDRDPTVTGVDLLYIADQTSGILKYSFNGTTWTARGSVTGAFTGITGFYNKTTGNVELYVTSGTAGGNTVRKYEDAAAYNATISTTNSTIFTANTRIVLRGIAFVPYTSQFPVDASFSVSGGGSICQGSAGVSINSSGSERGVNYQLKRSGVNVGTPIDGTGNALNFGAHNTPGIYKVFAKNPLTNDTATLAGSATIVVNDSSIGATSITSDKDTVFTTGTVKFKKVGGTLGNGATWKWYKNGCGTTLIGTGDSISIAVSSYADTTVYLRAEGSCNTTICVKKTIKYIQLLPNIKVLGNNNLINNNQTATSYADSTKFGKTDTLTSIIRSYKIKNTGNDTLKLNGSPKIQFSGTNAIDFTSIGTVPNFVKVGDSIFVYIKFSPKGIGARTATISVNNNTASNSPYTWNVEGEGKVSCDSFYPLENSIGLHKSASSYTTPGGWTCYCNSTGKLLLSLKLGGTGAVVSEKDSVELKINSLGATFYPFGTGFVGNPNGWVGLNRTWEVIPRIQPTNPVPVRFYFTNSDVDSINKQLQLNGLSSITASQMSYYKVINSAKPIHSAVNSLAQADVKIIMPSVSLVSDTTWKFGTLNSNNFAEFMVSSFSGGGGGASSGGLTPLPVIFLNFNVKVINNTFVKLNWEVQNNLNISHFEIERSEDGRDFKVINRIKESLNLNQNYEFKDFEITSGILYYYRIKAIFTDKLSKEISNIIGVQLNLPINSNIELFPNPTNEILNLHIKNSLSIPTQYCIKNQLGQSVSQGEFETTQFQLETKTLPSGMYLIQINQNGLIETRKFFVHH